MLVVMVVMVVVADGACVGASDETCSSTNNQQRVPPTPTLTATPTSSYLIRMVKFVLNPNPNLPRTLTLTQ
jgi:hypothetical protein